METTLQLVLAGILQGGVYALAAIGLSLSLGLMGGVNLTHGEWVMLGALGTWLLAKTGAPLLLAIPASCAAVGVLAFMVYALVIKRAFSVPQDMLTRTSLLATLGLAFLIQESAAFAADQPLWSLFAPGAVLRLGPFRVSSVRIVMAALLALSCVAVWIALNRSDWGRAARAAIADRGMAALMGVPVRGLQGVIFALSSALAALAGGFSVLLFSAWPRMGLPLAIKCLFIVMLGRAGSVRAPIIGGLFMGLTESLFSALGDGRWAGPASLSILLIAVALKERVARS